MDKWIRMSALALLLGLGAVGCQREEAQQAGQEVSQATDRAGETIRETTGDIGAATTLTPDIKSAIIADSQLNDPSNRINVDSTDEVVRLTGHVTSNALKQKAGEIAQRVLNERNAKNKLSNELVVESR
jgi:osmotically-inducible protein OsmY